MNRDSQCTALVAVAITALFVVGPGNTLVPSDHFQITVQDPNGISSYLIFYRVSPRATIGSNLTVTVMLLVNDLTGLKLYLRDYSLTALLVFQNGHVIGETINSSVLPEGLLYLGGRWGPFNISLPLTERNTGLSSGQTEKANVTIGLLTNVWTDAPVGLYIPESGQGSAGTVQVQDESVGSSYGFSTIPFLLVASGVALLTVRVVIFRSKLERVYTQKPILST